MTAIDKAMLHLNRTISEREQHPAVPFAEFLAMVNSRPNVVLRNIFQVFHNMIRSFVGDGFDEYPDDPETINFVYYDCSRLLAENTDHPFFADRLFANRLINQVEAMKGGAQQNKIYIFRGPPGSGKSTFLNNLLMKFEEYANTDAGSRFETVWRLDRKILGVFAEQEVNPFLDKLSKLLDEYEFGHKDVLDSPPPLFMLEDYIEVPCVCHDNPVLMIPKEYRRAFFEDLFQDNEFKTSLFTDKEYEWVFRDNACTICSSLYQALLSKLKNPQDIYRMIYARPYRFNRRLGEGISVFNPGDKPLKQTIITNPMVQRRINDLLKDSNQVNYIYSRFAKTNNGIYALMDIKSYNTERLIELHNIISEGVHKVEDIEENVNSLFLALMNPEDEHSIQGFQSFSDRIEFINIPYVMDLNTEVEIYRNIFGRHIDESFLPRVLHNFARVVISTRLNVKSDALLEWIVDPAKYYRYCDENLQLLKMEIYTGHIPLWLSEDDRKRLNAKRRRKIIAESESEGEHGFSGRDSIRIFSEFFSTYVRKDKLINMTALGNFFTKLHREHSEGIPEGFLASLLRNYNYTILEEVKESLYNYNEMQIKQDILNYMFAVNFEIGTVEQCTFTGAKLEINDDFFRGLENRLLGSVADLELRFSFRKETQKEYTSRTLTQEMMVEGKNITDTRLYNSLHDLYVHSLKQKVLDPFMENENFRRAIKDFDSDAFKTYDKRIRSEVTFLISNLCRKYHYTKLGAKEVCIYVIDNDLTSRFTEAMDDNTLFSE
jgi:predicted Ser/Thr protein kinase